MDTWGANVKKPQRKAGAKRAEAKRPEALGGSERAKGGPAKGSPAKGGPAKKKPVKSRLPKSRSAVSAPATSKAEVFPSVGDGVNVVRVSRILDAPAAAILRAIIDTDRRGWAPTPLYRVVSVLAPRFVRLALPDGSEVSIAITRQGNTRCGVQVEHGKIPANRTQAEVHREWMGCLAGLAEQLDAEWD
ncbi:MAG: hypothetical protein IBJ03_07500 [Gemmatimonadaceae bacterium]|nr:hypothetical protein [Gemmatimonadaceae bacterium]